MAKTPKLYTRLTRSVASVATYQSLWLGSDHLMLVTSTGYTESYARLQFRDIKGFFITRSDRRLGWGIAWGLLTALFLIIVATSLSSNDPPIFGIIFLVLSAGALLWNQLLGPGCHAYVVTGVQTAKLPSMVRLKKARRVLGLLQPLIEASQADLVMPVPPQPPPVSAPAPAPTTPLTTAGDGSVGAALAAPSGEAAPATEAAPAPVVASPSPVVETPPVIEPVQPTATPPAEPPST